MTTPNSRSNSTSASGDFAVKPGARYHVLTQLADGEHDQLVQADTKGWLAVTLQNTRCQMTITSTESTIDIERRPPPANTGDQSTREIDIKVVPNSAD